jgi:hypothetical protein
METKCVICGEVFDWTPVYCCKRVNRNCDCGGRPLYPPLCSGDCEIEAYKPIEIEENADTIS